MKELIRKFGNALVCLFLGHETQAKTVGLYFGARYYAIVCRRCGKEFTRW